MSFNLCDLNFVYAKEGWVSNYCTCREWQYLLTYAIHRYVIYSRPDVNFVNGTARVGRFVCENCAQMLVVVSPWPCCTVRPPTQRSPTLRRQPSEIYEWTRHSFWRGERHQLYACLQSVNGALEKTSLASRTGDCCAECRGTVTS